MPNGIITDLPFTLENASPLDTKTYFETIAEMKAFDIRFLSDVAYAVNKETGKIALSLKDMTTDPWLVEAANLEVGQVVTAEITRFASFGAFAKVTELIEGLIHISQISEKRVHKVEDVLELGQKVQVKIIALDKEAKKVGLSMKQVEEEVDDSMRAYMSTGDEQATLGDVMGDTL